MSRLRTAMLAVLITVFVAACSSAATAAPSFVYSTTGPATQAPASLAPSVDANAPLTIALSEWKVATGSTLKAGKATFAISNAGTIPHELLIFKSALAPAAYPTDTAGDIVEDGSGVKLVSDGENIEPGKSQSRAIDLAPGTYLFVCNIPGHFKAGMFTVVTVTQ